MNKDEAYERLEKLFYRIDHPEHCMEPDPHFVDEDKDYPQYDGCLVVKCWNCEVQDHFLYE
jgi:hypothetical protein